MEEVMEVWLLNAAHMKAVPGRKTDVRDAEWIAQLLEHGLLAPSFVPPPGIRSLRMLTRYRVQLMGDRTRECIRLEMMLEDASIKLSSVASTLTTVSARAMLAAMIAGERDPLVLAELAKGKMRRKIPDLAQALEGHFDAHHAQLARSILNRLDMVEQDLVEADEAITVACAPWAHQIELLQTIPSVGERVAQVIVAETGADMSRFPSAAHLASWAGLAPSVYQSAGRTRPSGTRHGNKWLCAMLVESAGSVGRMKGKNYLAAQHARLTKRRGAGRAQVAVAHSILVCAYHMLKNDEPYLDVGADWLARRNQYTGTTCRAPPDALPRTPWPGLFTGLWELTATAEITITDPAALQAAARADEGVVIAASGGDLGLDDAEGEAPDTAPGDDVFDALAWLIWPSHGLEGALEAGALRMLSVESEARGDSVDHGTATWSVTAKLTDVQALRRLAARACPDEATEISASLAVAWQRAADPFAPLRSVAGITWKPGRVLVEHLPARANRNP
ncbi:IS110 family RNA-guided transposase [Ornithinimicrobium avium]|uniref:IS110 family transposase n=1 Tax=Ornithinimicrobium avium TaxID=2283195 RepID=UPI00227710FD|nr:IS110 family transposase [Ornithinimicrobium avium]